MHDNFDLSVDCVYYVHAEFLFSCRLIILLSGNCFLVYINDLISILGYAVQQ